MSAAREERRHPQGDRGADLPGREVPAALPAPLVRTATTADLERMAWLEEVAFPDPWPLDLIAHEVANQASLLLVASLARGAPAAGYASFRQGGGEAELLRLAVAPEARRRGAARALVTTGLERLRQAGVERCFLEVRPTNLGAIACYRTLGFEPAGRRRAYYRDGMDALIYARGV